MNIRAVDIQLISKGLQINQLEKELRENKDRWTGKELSDWARKLKQSKLRACIRDYKELLKKGNLVEEHERYQEQEADRIREERILNKDLFDYED